MLTDWYRFTSTITGDTFAFQIQYSEGWYTETQLVITITNDSKPFGTLGFSREIYRTKRPGAIGFDWPEGGTFVKLPLDFCQYVDRFVLNKAFW